MFYLEITRTQQFKAIIVIWNQKRNRMLVNSLKSTLAFFRESFSGQGHYSHHAKSSGKTQLRLLFVSWSIPCSLNRFRLSIACWCDIKLQLIRTFLVPPSDGKPGSSVASHFSQSSMFDALNASKNSDIFPFFFKTSLLSLLRKAWGRGRWLWAPKDLNFTSQVDPQKKTEMISCKQIYLKLINKSQCEHDHPPCLVF